MIKLSNKELKALQNGEITVEKMAEQIASIYPAKSFVEAITVQPTPVDKIKITEQQFKELFKIVGVKDVTMEKAERRGRPAKKGE